MKHRRRHHAKRYHSNPPARRRYHRNPPGMFSGLKAAGNGFGPFIKDSGIGALGIVANQVAKKFVPNFGLGASTMGLLIPVAAGAFIKNRTVRQAASVAAAVEIYNFVKPMLTTWGLGDFLGAEPASTIPPAQPERYLGDANLSTVPTMVY